MILQVPSAERGRFDQIIRRFRDCWHADFSGALLINQFDEFLPSSSDPLRRAVLLEIVAIDLVTRIERGDRISLQTYLKQIDELGPADRLPVKLLQVEYFHRLRSGNPVSADAVASMFPTQAREFLLSIESANQSSSSPHRGTLVFDAAAESREILPIPALPRQPHKDDSRITDRVERTQSPFDKSDPWGTVKKPVERVVSLESGYRMIRKIGQGNFGEVWLSEAPGGVEVALKVVRIPAGQKTKNLEMRSLDLMKKMRHPFLMQVQAFWTSEEQILIAMELADNSLRDQARQCGSDGMPLPELLRYMTEAAEGIDFLHREHVVHRDIKPENLLLMKGHVKVADFGLARFMDESGLTVIATQVAGSPLYMAPEVWEGKPVSFSDQYSLAVTYAELRMGHAPFSTSSMVAVMHEHLYGQPQLDGMSGPEQAVLKIALAKRPHDRYESCSDMVQALVEATKPLVAPELGPVPAEPTVWRWAWIPAIAVMILFVALAFKYWPDFVPAPDPELAINLREVIEIEYGGRKQTPITTVNRADTIDEVIVKNSPIGVKIDFNKASLELELVADLNAPEGHGDVELTVSTTPRGPIDKKLKIKFVESASLRLPKGTTRTSLDTQRVKPKMDNWIFYESVSYKLPNGDRIEFVLIPREQSTDPPSFYMMKQEVSNRWFAEFVSANSKIISSDSLWQKGALAGTTNASVTENRGDYPVVHVSVNEAHSFAEWLGGLLPTAEQWDTAAGIKKTDRGEGPFRQGWSKICIGRMVEGPCPCATSNDDVSLLGILDLAGNVRELTRNVHSGLNVSLVVPQKELVGSEAVILRGNSYHYPDPWRFDSLGDGVPESLPYQESCPDVGFRVVLENK